jgi:hypothetical protein
MVPAGMLQKAELITYQRGHVNIVDQPRRESAACECHTCGSKQNKNKKVARQSGMRN